MYSLNILQTEVFQVEENIVISIVISIVLVSFFIGVKYFK